MKTSQTEIRQPEPWWRRAYGIIGLCLILLMLAAGLYLSCRGPVLVEEGADAVEEVEDAVVD